MTTLDKLANEWADYHYNKQLERGKQRMGEDALKEWIESNADWIRDYRQGLIDEWNAKADSIRSKNETFCKSVNQGGFHPSNTFSRRLFIAITGISLPSTVGGTLAAIESYAGNKLAAYRQRVNEANRAAEEEERKKEEEKHRVRMESIIAKIEADKEIDGVQLLDIAKHLGISIPIQSMGAIRNRVYSVNSYSSRITGNGRFTSQAHFKAYRQCQQRILELRQSAVS